MLVCHNTLANSIGKEYKKKTSIPQGDPFSMMVVALLLRPWIEQMKSYAVQPRLLADDLQILSTGPNHLANFEFAFDKTHKHLEDMGAKLAPTESMTFPTCTATSNWLKQHRWPRAGATIPLVGNYRDLGAHLSVSAKKKQGRTLTKRMVQATMYAIKASYVKAPYRKKAALARGKITPMGVFGCETCLVSENSIVGLRSNIADMLAFSSNNRSVELTYSLASAGTDADPDVEIAVRRVMTCRRNVHKGGEVEKMMKENFQMYINQKEPGTQRSQEEISYKQPGGPPKSKQRMRLRKARAKGPTGLLIETAHVNGANIDEQFKIRQLNQPTLDIIQDPFQDIKPLWKQAVVRNRTAAVCGTRKETEGLKEIDDYASRPAHNKFKEDERMHLEIMRTGVVWDRCKEYWAGRAEDCNCVLCGKGRTG